MLKKLSVKENIKRKRSFARRVKEHAAAFARPQTFCSTGNVNGWQGLNGALGQPRAQLNAGANAFTRTGVANMPE